MSLKNNLWKSFWKDIYKNGSFVPYVITAQTIIFIILYLFDLLQDVNSLDVNLFNWTYNQLVLPNDIQLFLSHPWSFITHPFIYKGFFNLLFDCLWLYWLSQLFLTFLKNRQLAVVFFGGIILHALLFFSISQIPFLNISNSYLATIQGGLTALIASLFILIPNYEIRLLLIGNIKFKFIAIVYVAITLISLMSNNAILISYIATIAYGLLYMIQLQKGNEWFKSFKRQKKLKIVKNKAQYTSISSNKRKTDLPNQAEIDLILDKISENGYESLNSYEKEALFQISKAKK